MALLQTTIYEDISCFDLLQTDWLALLQKSTNNEIFLTPQFLKPWWRYFKQGTLKIITFKIKEKLIGLVPFFLFKNQLKTIGCLDLSDYLDIIVDQEYQIDVYQSLATIIIQQPAWHNINLCSLRQKSATSEKLITLLNKNFILEKKQQNICPVITLDDTFAKYLLSLDRHQRHEIKRKQRKLFTQTTTHYVLVKDKDQVKKAMDEFIRLHKLSNQKKENFWHPNQQQFFKTMAYNLAAAGWLKLYFLQINESYYASMLVFDYNNEFLLYNSGFDALHYASYSPGSILTAYIIEQAIKLGKKRFDFLRGDELYKFRFNAVAEPIYNLIGSRKS